VYVVFRWSYFVCGFESQSYFVFPHWNRFISYTYDRPMKLSVERNPGASITNNVLLACVEKFPHVCVHFCLYTLTSIRSAWKSCDVLHFEQLYIRWRKKTLIKR
jgi:hypothetical protein